MKGYENALALLPPSLACAVENSGRREALQEIRLRKNGVLSLTVGGENLCVDAYGHPCRPEKGLRCVEEDLLYVVEKATDGSLYRYMPALQKGYVTTPAGVRVGICGTGVYASQNGAERIEISSLNLRLPREGRGCAREALAYYHSKGLASTLFYAPPGGGKTTLMRDLSRGLSMGELGSAYRVAVADEREEIFPAEYPSLGLLDVMRGYTKEEAMECALRVLNPQILVCDEVGNGDCGAIRRLATSGIVFMATAHASSKEELLRRGELGELIREGYFPLLAEIRFAPRGLGVCFCSAGELP